MAREFFPESPEAPPVPVPLAPDGWRDLLARPELRCVESWGPACAAWWTDDRDRRLRDRALRELVLTDDELAAWLGTVLERRDLVRAHEHVVSMRAGLERDVTQRKLDTDGLRTGVVWSRHRGGGRTIFVPPEDVPRLVDSLCAQLAVMPAHPFLRAAFLIQAIGAVHPFRDGNGGASRFFASLELVRHHLPPFTLDVGLRNAGYIHALMESNQSGSLDRLSLLVADVVQRCLAGLLLAGDAPPASWDAALAARADRWCAQVDATWRDVAGAPGVVAAAAGTGVLVRLVERGYRVPVIPAPRCASWQLAAPLPVRLDALIAPVRGGGATWLVAMIAATAGDGALGAVALTDAISPVFVAAGDEPDEVADARFARWLAVRTRQYAQGIAHWT
jgi:hypothetical protein